MTEQGKRETQLTLGVVRPLQEAERLRDELNALPSPDVFYVEKHKGRGILRMCPFKKTHDPELLNGLTLSQNLKLQELKQRAALARSRQS